MWSGLPKLSLECFNQLWAPHRKKVMGQMEPVEKKVTRIVKWHKDVSSLHVFNGHLSRMLWEGFKQEKMNYV